MKKNDAAPFPPSKLLLKNDEFNVKQYCRSRGYHGMPGARGTIAPPFLQIMVDQLIISEPGEKIMPTTL